MTNAKLGVPNELRRLKIAEESAADALTYKWDKSANKIKVFREDAVTGVLAEHTNATFTSPDEFIIEVEGW